MVGGRVIEVRRAGDLIRLWVADTRSHGELAILVRPAPEMPEPGDGVWWQGSGAYWTPADRRFEDRRLERVGSAFDPRPIREEV